MKEQFECSDCGRPSRLWPIGLFIERYREAGSFTGTDTICPECVQNTIAEFNAIFIEAPRTQILELVCKVWTETGAQPKEK